MEVSGLLHAPATLPQEKNPVTLSIGCYIGPRASLDILQMRKIPCSCKDSNSRLSSPLPCHCTKDNLKIYMSDPPTF